MICIITRYVKYKENDAIVDSITDSGMVTFLAKGLLKTTCKNSFIKNTPCICEIEFLPDKYKYPIMKNGKCLISPYSNNDQLESFGAILTINELLVKCLQKEDSYKIFNNLYQIISALDKGCKPLAALIKIINDILSINGTPMSLNQCNKCRSKENIIGFSFSEGGFICKNCDNGTIRYDLQNEAMMLYREICLNDLKQTKEYQYYSKDSSLEIVNKACAYIYSSIGADIKNIKLLN